MNFEERSNMDKKNNFPTIIYFSEASTPINHYMAFSNTMECKSAKVIREPITRAGRDKKPSFPEFYTTIETLQDPESHSNPHLASNNSLQDLHEQNNIRTLVAMPAYNEENQIAKTILRSAKYADAVLVVDDGSTDATVEIAEALGAIVIQHKINTGYGGALQTIFRTARDLGVEELVILDSDGQHNPLEIPLLLEKLREGVDVVIGSRFINGMDSSIPVYRKVGMKVLDEATMMASGTLNVTDSQSGFRAYSKRAIETIKINGNGMSAGSEILVKLDDNNLTVCEVPIKVRYDIGNTSSENPVSHGIYILWQLVGIIGYRRPLLSFGLPGTILVIFGLILGSLAFADYQLTSKFSFPLSMTCILFLIMGMLLVTTAFILNSLTQIVKMERMKEPCDVAREN